MTQVWVVKYDNGMYLFGSLEVAEQSIRNIHNEIAEIEKEELSDQQWRFTIIINGRVQDQVMATAFDVYDQPAVIHREQVLNARAQRPPRNEF